MSYFPITSKDHAEMLETIGIEHFGQLFQAIPSEIRNPKIDLPPALSEMEAQSWFRELAQKNVSVKNHLSFLGAGAFEHFVPSQNLCGNADAQAKSCEEAAKTRSECNVSKEEKQTIDKELQQCVGKAKTTCKGTSQSSDVAENSNVESLAGGSI